MHWELSEEQELFASSLREWIAAKFPSDAVREIQSSGTRRTFDDALIGEGWWGVGYDESSGGQGGGVLELALAAREFGRAASPDSGWMAAALAARLLTADELAAQLGGTSRFAVAMRADRIPSWSRTDTDGARVSTTVRNVIGALDASTFLLPVVGPDGPAIARLSASEANVAAENVLDRSRSAATVTFTDASISSMSDASAFEHIAPLSAVLVAADALGAAERMLELAVEYSKQRKQFGQLIGGFQAIKHACAQMLVTVEASFSTALYAAAALDAALPDAATTAAVAKAQVTGPVADLADSALTVHGAIGYTWEHDLHLYYKRAKLDRTLYGTPGDWNERVAAELLDSAVAQR